MDISTLFFILGYLISIVANIQLIMMIRKDKHVEGLSFQTQIIFCVASITKVFYFNMTVLALHWLGWAELILSIMSAIYLVLLFIRYRKLSFNTEKSYMYAYILIPACILLSIVFHPGFFEDGFDFPSMMIACGVSIIFV